MAFFNKHQKSFPSKSRKQKENEKISLFHKLYSPYYALRILLFFAFSFLVVAICFVGQFPSTLQVIPNQIAKIRVVAEFPFSYISDIQTQRKQNLLRKQIPPVYSIDNKNFDHFSNFIITFLDQLDQLQTALVTANPEETTSLIEALSKSYKEATSTHLSPEDISLILKKTDAETRKKIFSEALIILNSITKDGIFKPLENEFGKSRQESEGPYFFSIEADGKVINSKIQSEKDALRTLSLNISAMDIDWNLSRAIFRVLKAGITPNLIYDAEKSNEKIQNAIKTMPPAIIEIPAGHTIIEPGSIVAPEQMEQLRAYHDFIISTEGFDFQFNTTLRERTILTLVLIFTAILYLRIAQPSDLKATNRLTLAALAMIVNLSLIRAILEIGDISIFEKNLTILSVLPFAVPFAFAPMIITIMIGPRLATVVAALTSTFYALMLGSLTSFLLIALLASLVSIYFCKNVPLRADVLRASVFSSLTVALSSFFIGTFNQIPINIILFQILFALLTGALTGLIIIGIIPFIEKFFNFTTNITLLELTDFNHPLLRRLQLEAPGTYHHSILVANLAERAASEINANPLICRVTALFHDIGKLVKPEYFVENQSSGINPHLERNPSMSAIVIKSHISEGVELAKDYKLPSIIIDVIKQHHGTSLIKYFYDKALKQKRQTQLPFTDIEETTSSSPNIDESSFRYQGPTPQFPESAIVSLADSIQAASLSLKKVSSTNVDDLIDSVFKEKINDHQLDFSHLTLNEINILKKSFSFTLLNMLHSRIEYPSKDKEPIQEIHSSHESHDISRYSSH